MLTISRRLIQENKSGAGIKHDTLKQALSLEALFPMPSPGLGWAGRLLEFLACPRAAEGSALGLSVCLSLPPSEECKYLGINHPLEFLACPGAEGSSLGLSVHPSIHPSVRLSLSLLSSLFEE